VSYSKGVNIPHKAVDLIINYHDPTLTIDVSGRSKSHKYPCVRKRVLKQLKNKKKNEL